MTNILLITSSPRGDASYSTQVATEVVRDLQDLHPDAVVTSRDLARSPLPHIDEGFVAALALAPAARSAEQSAQIARSDALIDELAGADILVIASPMYNFGLPSTLKAWRSHLSRRPHVPLFRNRSARPARWQTSDSRAIPWWCLFQWTGKRA